MRQVFATLFACAMLAAAALPFAAQAQQERRGRTADPVRTASAAELVTADRRLNQIYQRRIADARATDRTDRRRALPRGWYGQEAALRESERQWIEFRNAECRYLTQQSMGARSRPALLRACLLNRTNDRIADLRDAELVLSQR